MRSSDRIQLAQALRRIREQTLLFFADDDPLWLRVPCLPILNPPLWELGHIGWFQEHWTLRWPLPESAGPNTGVALAPSMLAHADALFDSSRVAHDTRWDLPLPSLAQTRDYLRQTLAATLERLAHCDDDDASLYFFRLAFFHECMHVEALSYTWQTLGRGAPAANWIMSEFADCAGELHVPGGDVVLGRARGGFAHDNELPAIQQHVEAYRIASHPVSNREFLAFVQDDGYRNPDWWAPADFNMLSQSGRHAPRRWRVPENRAAEPAHWRQQWFGQWLPLMPHAPVVHVDAREAQAYCRWAGVQLPTEAQWVQAARTQPEFHWGNHVWEWTATPLEPFPGFRPGPYREYAEPWFGTHRVVKGGSFITPRDMVDADFRNFYTDDRADPFMGFRVCR